MGWAPNDLTMKAAITITLYGQVSRSDLMHVKLREGGACIFSRKSVYGQTRVIDVCIVGYKRLSFLHSSCLVRSNSFVKPHV